MKSLLIWFLVLLCSCASVTQTFDQSVQVAASVNDAVIVTANSLLTAGTITSTQAKKVLAITDNVNALLTAANTAYTAGNTALANSNLATANTAATQTQTCLSTPSTLNTCLSGVAP
jgi:hypothetical protein